jgi:hypothetical protein
VTVTFVATYCSVDGEAAFYCRWQHKVDDGGVVLSFEGERLNDGGVIARQVGSRAREADEVARWSSAANTGLWCFERPIIQEECGGNLGAIDVSAEDTSGRLWEFRYTGADGLVPALPVVDAVDRTLERSMPLWLDAGLAF